MSLTVGTDSTDDTIFGDLNAENEDSRPMEIESLCMNCMKNVSFLSY